MKGLKIGSIAKLTKSKNWAKKLAYKLGYVYHVGRYLHAHIRLRHLFYLCFLKYLSIVIKSFFALQDVQFEMTFQNVLCLQSLFNPSFGNITKTSEGFFNWLQYLLDSN